MSELGAEPKAVLLVAEDEFLVALDLQTTLEENGYEICGLAATAREAIELAKRHQPDLALVDINLARGSNGLEAVETLKKEMDIPAIVVTGHGTTQEARNAGALGCLNKPFDFGRLLPLIDTVLACRAGNPPPRPAPMGLIAT